MASREFLKIMKSARSGDALAQQKIGEIYMLGEPGTPKNPQNALLWLEKSSVTIGFNEEIFNLVSSWLDLEVNLPLPQSLFAWKCLIRSAATGNTHARWVVAQVTVAICSGNTLFPVFTEITPDHWAKLGDLDELKKQAHRYLEELADLSSFDHQALAIKLLSECLAEGHLGVTDVERSKKMVAHLAKQNNSVGLESLLSIKGEIEAHLLPALKTHLPTLLASKEPLPEHQFLYWAAWQHFQNFDALEIAAEMAYAPAQLILGLKLAKLNLVTSTEVDTSNESSDDVSGNARLKKAVYWLKQAANQGLRDAWYALGLINRMPQYSGYSAEDSDACFDKAAELGYPEAQYKKGAALWRRRSQLDEPIEGLQASYWVWHAAQQGVIPAKELLSKMMLSSPNPSNNDWFHLAQATQLALNETPHRYSAEMLLMCHRVIVANQLNLSKAELLLIDMMSVQHEHGAVIDIREHLPKSTPKLILIETLEQRKALMIASKAFASAATIDEGNLRQRRYRLDKLIETLVETSELTQAAALDPQDLT